MVIIVLTKAHAYIMIVFLFITSTIEYLTIIIDIHNVNCVM